MFSKLPHITFHTFDNRSNLFEVLSNHIIEQLNLAIRQYQTASMVLSGGSTPVPLYQKMAKANLDWKRVIFTLSDERWVPPSDEASNQKMIVSHLTPPGTSLQFQPLIPAETVWTQSHSPVISDHLAELNNRISQLPKPYTSTLLGMGNDAHTASLFPCAKELPQAFISESALAHMNPKTVGQHRITMTLRELNNSNQIILLITGEEKLKVMEKALSADSVLTHPIKAILKPDEAERELKIGLSHTPVAIYWCS